MGAGYEQHVEAEVLKILAEYSALDAAQLAALSRFHKDTVYAAMKRLAAKGLINVAGYRSTATKPKRLWEKVGTRP
jgi:sugar-specific transcriptional regulator TrmB